jgi:hypothetical protein
MKAGWKIEPMFKWWKTKRASEQLSRDAPCTLLPLVKYSVNSTIITTILHQKERESRCSQLVQDCIGTPTSSASVALSSVRVTTTYNGSEVISLGSSPSTSGHEAGLSLVPTDQVEFDLDASEQDALLVKRSRKT